MAKYIDADELRTRIYRLIKTETSEPGNLWDEGFSTCVGEINDIITYLQQEQVLPGIENPGIPGKDFIPVEWVDACEMYGKWKIVKQEQPVLPDNLDDVAKQLYPIITEEAKSDEWKIANREYNDMCIKLQDAFRKGAEWMAKQGVTVNGSIEEISDGNHKTIDIFAQELDDVWTDGDCEVIIQIRKK